MLPLLSAEMQGAGDELHGFVSKRIWLVDPRRTFDLRESISIGSARFGRVRLIKKDGGPASTPRAMFQPPITNFFTELARLQYSAP